MSVRWGVVLLAALVPAVALALDPSGWYPFGPSKWLVVTTLVTAGAAALLLSRRPIRVEPRLWWASVALLSVLAVSAAVGLDGAYAWLGTPERHFGVIAWLVCTIALVAGQNLDTERDHTALAWGIAVAALGAGALATIEALGWEPSVFAVTDGRLTATMGSAAYLGALTALLLPVTVGIAVDRTLPRALRGVAAVAIIPLTIALLGSGARAAWLGVIAAAATVAVMQRARLGADRRRTLGGAIAAVIVIALVIAVSPVGSRLASIGDEASGGASRVDEWHVAARVLAAHPLTGVGPEGYRIAFAESVDDQYEQQYGRDPLPDRAHSGPLDVAVAGGIPALIAWLVVVAMIGGAALPRSGPTARCVAGMAAGVIAHFVGQLLLFPTAELEPAAWLLAGVVVAATTPTRPVPWRVARPAGVALAVVAAVALVAGTLDVVADRHAAVAATVVDRERAVREATAAVDRRPDELRLHLLLAQSLAATGRGSDAAISAVDDALQISPDDPIARRYRAQLMVQRAAATHLPTDVAAARTEIDTLVHDDPHNASLWLLAGAAARLAADAPAAEAAFVRAEALSPRSSEPSVELARLYLDTGRVTEARAAADRAVAREPQNPAALAIQREAMAN